MDPTHLDFLQCPVTRQPLARSESGLTTPDGSHIYPVVSGVPILLPDAWGDSPTAFPTAGHSTPLRRLGRRIRPPRPAPFTSRRQFQRLLRDLLQHPVRERPRVLVIGGGRLGDGMDVLSDDPTIDLIETDIYHSSRTDLLCDGHSLPFRDESIDGVIVQAVLEHVRAPSVVVEEIHRVLRPGGLVYAETPFMQQVHEDRTTSHDGQTSGTDACLRASRNSTAASSWSLG